MDELELDGKSSNHVQYTHILGVAGIWVSESFRNSCVFEHLDETEPEPVWEEMNKTENGCRNIGCCYLLTPFIHDLSHLLAKLSRYSLHSGCIDLLASNRTLLTDGHEHCALEFI